MAILARMPNITMTKISSSIEKALVSAGRTGLISKFSREFDLEFKQESGTEFTRGLDLGCSHKFKLCKNFKLEAKFRFKVKMLVKRDFVLKKDEISFLNFP